MVDVEHRNTSYKGMMNIGNRPTLNGSHQTTEVHLFDFDQKIYGDSLKVLIVKKIREELKFDSLEALKTQLAIDQEICKRTDA
jgi:riboflavin kinase/FMN adenylyltransferase